MRALQVNLVSKQILSAPSPSNAGKLVYIASYFRAVRKFKNVELDTKHLLNVEAMLLDKHLVESDVPSSEYESS